MIELRGQVVRSIWIDASHENMLFVTDSGGFLYNASGDCCSVSWFHEAINISALFNSRVWSVEEADCIEAPGTRQERDLVYGYRLRTDQGTVTIAFRNSSNGYYGGSVTHTRSDEDSFVLSCRVVAAGANGQALTVGNIEYHQIVEDFESVP